MTYLQLLESVEQLFPNFGRTQIGLELNRSYKEFVNRCKLLTAEYDMPEMTTWENITTNWEDMTIGISYTLPSDVDAIYELSFLDSDNRIVDISKTSVQGYEIKNGELVLYVNYTKLFDIALFSDFQYVKIQYYKIPDNLSSDADTTAIDSQFDDAILMRTNQKFAEKSKDYKGAIYYKAEYRDWLREGKRKGANLQDGMVWEMKTEEYPGQ